MNKISCRKHNIFLRIVFFLIGFLITVNCFAKEVSEDKRSRQADAIILGLSMLQSQNLLITPLLVEPSEGSENSYFVDFFYLGSPSFPVEKKQFLAQLKFTGRKATIRIASVKRSKLPALSSFVQQAIISSVLCAHPQNTFIIDVKDKDVNGELFISFQRLPSTIGSHSTVLVTPNRLEFFGGM